MNSINEISQAPDTTLKYSIKQVSEMLGISTYTIRYYEKEGLIPFVERTESNIRIFSDYTIEWLRLVNCLRQTGMPIEEVKLYNKLCMQGDSTIKERKALIEKQEDRIYKQIKNLQSQIELLHKKKSHYKAIVEANQPDPWNPVNIYKKPAK